MPSTPLSSASSCSPPADEVLALVCATQGDRLATSGDLRHLAASCRAARAVICDDGPLVSRALAGVLHRCGGAARRDKVLRAALRDPLYGRGARRLASLGSAPVNSLLTLQDMWRAGCRGLRQLDVGADVTLEQSCWPMMAQMTALTSLSLSGPEDAEAPSDPSDGPFAIPQLGALAHLPRLVDLSLREMDVGTAASAAAQLTGLTRLVLSDSRMVLSHRPVAEGLGRLTALGALRSLAVALSKSGITSSLGEDACAAIGQLTQLCSLTLRAGVVGGSREASSRTLSRLTRLARLEVEGAMSLLVDARSLLPLTALTELRWRTVAGLPGEELLAPWAGDATRAPLAVLETDAALGVGLMTGLRELTLIGHNGAARCLPFLTLLTALTRLELRHWPPVRAEHGLALGALGALRSLELDTGRWIVDARHLRPLSALTGLIELTVHHLSAEPEGLVKWLGLRANLGWLAHLPQLSRLDVALYGTVAAGELRVIAGLSRLTDLRLGLIDSTDAAHVAATLAQLTSLTRLSLRQSQHLGSAALATLPHLSRLTHLSLENCYEMDAAALPTIASIDSLVELDVRDATGLCANRALPEALASMAGLRRVRGHEDCYRTDLGLRPGDGLASQHGGRERIERA